MKGLTQDILTFVFYVGVGLVSLAFGFALLVVVCGVIHDTWKSSFHGKLAILLGAPVVVVYIVWATKLVYSDILAFFR
jgi:hypothetical protein